ncbi:MAG: hypothetical protein E6R05_02095 [Candidatus Moraniibacteriota bacterium]|nr:MAG: hypothetical protein E6R05_02095 [Candidatus Moranbacteria bacterium]
MLQISQKTFLLIGLALLFLVSSGLFLTHDRALDPSQTGDWWAVRFVTLDNERSLAFEVENYSGPTTGSYQIVVGDAVREEQAFTAPSNTVTQVTPQYQPEDTERIRIVVTLGDKKQFLSR